MQQILLKRRKRGTWKLSRRDVRGNGYCKPFDADLLCDTVQIRSDIHRWLSPSNVQDDLRKYQTESMLGSCDWILQTHQFQALINSAKSFTLRVRGRPGAGKTFLATHIISHLTQKLQRVVLYFFCKAGDPEKRKSLHVLRTLLFQILRVDDSLYPLMETLYYQNGRAVADSYADVLDAFGLVMTKTNASPIYIILDALDECQDAHELVKALSNARKVSNTHLNIVLLMRDHPATLDSTGESDTELVLQPQVLHGPVERYVESRASKVKLLAGTDLGLTVTPAVSLASDGLWLYARLICDEIQHLPNAAMIQRQLLNLPRGLKECYTQALRSQEPSFFHWEITLSQQLFLWIDTEDFMPAWAITDGDFFEGSVSSIVLQFGSLGETVKDPVSLIRKLCSPLVEVYNDNDGDYALDFTDHTARQYVKWSSTAPSNQVPTILKPRRLRQLYRGVTAAWYLSECPSSEAKLAHLYQKPHFNSFDPYYEIAYGLWNAFMLRSLPADLDDDELNHLTDLCEQLIEYINTPKCLRWVEIAIIVNYANGSMTLWKMAEAALAAASGPSSTLVPFEQFRRARQIFFADYAYALRLTGPGFADMEAPTAPDGFHKRRVAQQMLFLGKKWEALHWTLEFAIQSTQSDYPLGLRNRAKLGGRRRLNQQQKD